ncbi:tail fiber protein [Flavobacterium anhuiense]|uniref:Uncharacterized protein n=1 Tax=Flavobacterium anhuiense TaxID=459526 RepID=A0ABY0LY72_9FLAO|nr:tail fiber protein [Flavobacterium anhuiense]SCY78205.1 hypothetical protein SAMN02927916_3358 [Flavobacterium anhuiense]
MKKIFLIGILILCSKYSFGQVSGSFNVGGDFDKFYPVTFVDNGWNNNTPTNVFLSRANIHLDSTWRGSLMASFKYHVTGWGHGSQFIDADIKPSRGSVANFIAGWRDATEQGTCNCIIIWLRGGGTTYYYKSDYPINPTVYDGAQNALPYNEVNGPAHSYKTVVEEYATTAGKYQEKNAYFMANVGIGTVNPTSKLTVAGNIASREVKVTVDAGADFVFEKDYNLLSLESVDQFIKENKHLPEIASAEEMKKDGINLSEMNIKLLQKIEEMTLYMIEMKKRNDEMEKDILKLKQQK